MRNIKIVMTFFKTRIRPVNSWHSVNFLFDLVLTHVFGKPEKSTCVNSSGLNAMFDILSEFGGWAWVVRLAGGRGYNKPYPTVY